MELKHFNQPAPRYTSYPTAPEWESLQSETYAEKLKKLAKSEAPLSLYFHIPFCKTMCLYCGCSVLLNRKPENEERYVDYLFKEIDLVCSYLGTKREVSQIHFGGGTPTKLSIPLFGRLFEKINAAFEIDYTKEVAIEIDPRTVMEDEGEKLKFLRELGFNRVSFGVQDTNPKVQEAVKRRQSLEMTQWTFQLARTLGFSGINIDLIYGLPFQTTETFEETISHILEMHPDRIAFFSYAKVPWLKPHQKAIKEATLPSVEEKFQIYSNAREKFVEAGYVAIGMDHFALKGDEIAECYKNKTLTRNFQGYSVPLAEEMLGFGVTAIGFVAGTYVQNLKELTRYYESLDLHLLPVHRGKILSDEDHLRKWVIHTLMCTFELDKREFQNRFGHPFDVHFSLVQDRLAQLEAEGFIHHTPTHIYVTSMGELFIRLIVMSFDEYLKRPTTQPKFSQSI